jgi:hypothetical protein
MATDKKADKAVVKKETDPAVKKTEIVEDPNPKGTGDDKPAEGLQNGVPGSTVIVDATKDNEELDRIAGIVRSAYEGKGTFSEDMPTGFEETLIGKSEQEIIEAVKPYFIVADGSQNDTDPGDETPEDKNQELDQAKKMVDAIKEVAGGDKSKFKSKADELMKDQGLKEIWRCPNKGHWFSRKDYAENYKRENECSLEHYKK